MRLLFFLKICCYILPSGNLLRRVVWVRKKSDFHKTPSKLYHKKIRAYPKNFINNNNFNFLGYKNRQKSWHSCAIIEVRENLSKREQCRAHAALKLCLNLKTKIGGFVHIAQKLFTNYRGFAKNY